ncbi:MAG: TonB-dependent receptor plug domain-containing protein [Betaproteobacteria bacterium]
MIKRSVVAYVLVWWALLSAVSPVMADDEQVQLKEVTVTADRIEESVGETTSNVVVIKGEDVKKMNVQFVSDVLREVPDINLVQNGGPGQTATVLMRGGDSTQTLVMIDGVKVKSTTLGSFDFSGLTVDDIERIEIVKGPQSTLYGSEAMSGVINIITKKGKGAPKIDATVEGGSFNTSKSSASVSGGGEKTDYRLTGAYRDTQGISVAKQGSEKDGYKNTSVSGKVGMKPAENLELEFTGKYYHERAELDDFDFLARQAVDNPNYVQYGDHSVYSGRGKLYLFNAWEQILTVSTVADSVRGRDPIVAFNNYDFKTGMDTVDWQHNLFILDFNTITAGIEYRKEKGENPGSFDTSIENKAWYLNDRVKLAQEKLILNAGLRHDDNKISGGKTTYRAGALYDIQPVALKIRGNYGTGFRAPTFNELFFPFYGNLSLKPEESEGWDIGVDKEIYKDRASFAISYFEQEYKNLIDTDPNTFTAANIRRAEIKGVETTVTLRPTEEIRIKAGHTYLDTKDKDTGTRLSRRPGNKFTLTSEYTTTKSSVMIAYAFVGQRYDSIVQRNLSSYHLVGISGNYALSKWLALFARVDNVFNTKYEEAGSYGTPGFSVFGGIKISSL